MQRYLATRRRRCAQLQMLTLTLGVAAAADRNLTVGPFVVSFSPSQTLSLLALADPSRDDGFAFTRSDLRVAPGDAMVRVLSLIHISEPTRRS
eukprot:2052176-Prymnesium_polylepis.1